MSQFTCSCGAVDSTRLTNIRRTIGQTDHGPFLCETRTPAGRRAILSAELAAHLGHPQGTYSDGKP